MGDGKKVTDPEKLTLLYERFRDVCLVEKEVWKEVFLPREVTSGPVRTNLQDRYDVEIDDPVVEDTLDANIPRFITEGIGIQFYFGGTSLLIVVGVAMDTVNQVESQMIMRHYDGFMKKTRIRGRRG